MKKISSVAKNTVMLYIMAVVKLVLPLLTLPYLTRVLSEESYGLVSYVKSCMTYITLIIDFGFMYSSVKDIARSNGDLNEIGKITGNTFVAKFLLSILSAVFMLIMLIFIPLLRVNILFVVLSFFAVVSSLLLADFLFRGIEKMHYITIVFLIAKSISTIFTFLFVKGDGTILWIPVLDIISNVVSIVITFVFLHRLQIKIRFTRIKDCFLMIKDSFVYFLSNISSTAFTVLNTFLIGIYLKDLTQIAHWSLCLHIIGAIQGLYAPICNGIYPHMIKKKSLSFIHSLFKIFMPIVIGGCIFSFIVAKYALLIIGGKKYVESYVLFRWLIPILLFSFPAQVYGFPTLGAIGKEKAATGTIIISALAQVLGLIFLMVINQFTLIALAIVRGSTEFILLITRMIIVYKNKRAFSSEEIRTADFT